LLVWQVVPVTTMTPHGTNHPSRQATSTNDQLAAIAHFFDELEVKTPLKHFQRETDGNKALLDTMNALIAVVRNAQSKQAVATNELLSRP